MRFVCRLLSIAALVSVVGTSQIASAARTVTQSGPWWVVDSENFRVCGITDRKAVEGLSDACEQKRAELQSKWLGGATAEAWEPRCHVVLHPTADSYIREVGEGQTAGSSLIEFAGKQLSSRRVDLRADHPQGFEDALAHELTHVVVADRFIERQIPRWADEGMAVLADSKTKQSLHRADLDSARTQRATFRLVELLNLETYPEPQRQGAFYGQSLSVVEFLVARSGPETFVKFVERATIAGYDAALKEIYRFDDLAHLEQEWNRHVVSTQVAQR